MRVAPGVERHTIVLRAQKSPSYAVKSMSFTP